MMEGVAASTTGDLEMMEGFAAATTTIGDVEMMEGDDLRRDEFLSVGDDPAIDPTAIQHRPTKRLKTYHGLSIVDFEKLRKYLGLIFEDFDKFFEIRNVSDDGGLLSIDAVGFGWGIDEGLIESSSFSHEDIPVTRGVDLLSEASGSKSLTHEDHIRAMPVKPDVISVRKLDAVQLMVNKCCEIVCAAYEYESLKDVDRKIFVYNVLLKFLRRSATLNDVSVLMHIFRKLTKNNFVISINFSELMKEDASDKEVVWRKALFIRDWTVWLKEIESARMGSYVKKIATAVGLMTVIGAVCYVDWEALQKYISDSQVYEDFEAKVYRTMDNFVLSVFELEDFERVGCMPAIREECEEFYFRLCDLKSEENPLAALALAFTTDSRRDLNSFFLREHDAAYMYKQCRETFGLKQRWVSLLGVDIDHPIEERTFSQEEESRALTSMEKFVPLADDCRRHLNLEISSQMKCPCIFDNLYFEVWKELKILELKKYVPANILDRIATGFHHGMLSVANLKMTMLREFEEEVIFPLKDGLFGPCTEDVLEVVKHANHERRLQGCQFIGVQHILTCISQMGFAHSITRILDDNLLKKPKDVQLDSPVYDIYKSAQDLARSLCDDKMGIEHLFLATIFRKHGTDHLREAFGLGTLAVSCEWTWDAVKENKEVKELLACLKKDAEKRNVGSEDLKSMTGVVDLWNYCPPPRPTEEGKREEESHPDNKCTEGEKYEKESDLGDRCTEGEKNEKESDLGDIYTEEEMNRAEFLPMLASLVEAHERGSVAWYEELRTKLFSDLDVEPSEENYYPTIFFNKFWLLRDKFIALNETVTELPLNLEGVP